MFKTKNKKIILFSGIFLALIVSVLWYSFSYSYSEYGDYESVISIPVNSGETPYIERPGWMAISPNNGNIYLSDEGNRQVLIFNSNDEYQRKIYNAGLGEGQFAYPKGIVIGDDGSGNDVIFLVDGYSDKVLKFNYKGEFLLEWGSNGVDDGKFDNPQDIGIDFEGNIYVVDSDNSRIQKFDSFGNYITKWGAPGSDPGQFTSPNGIVVDSKNNIYVTDTYNNRVQKFDSSGNFITQWGSWGEGSLNFWDPMGILVDDEDNVYVIDQGNNNKIRKFDSNGNFLEIVISGKTPEHFVEEDGTISRAVDIEMNSEGDIYISDEFNRIQKFSLGTKTDYYQDLRFFYQNNGDFYTPSFAAIDSSNNIYVTDTQNNRIQKFDSSGNYLSQFGAPGSGNGQFKTPIGIVLDSFGNIFVVDSENNRIQKFDSSGNYVSQFGTPGSGNGQFKTPRGISIDSLGNIYVVDSENNRIQKFDSSGNYVSQFGTVGSLDGQFNSPVDIFLSADNNIYVADTGNNRVQIFDSFGNYSSQFGVSGEGDGQFKNPTDVFVDPSKNIYVVDSGNHRIQKFNSSGIYLSQFGSAGVNDGQFKFPTGIALDSSDNIYVVDTEQHRVQKFNNSFAHVVTWGSFFDLRLSVGQNLSVNPINDNIFYSEAAKGMGISEFDSFGNFVGFLDVNINPANPAGSVFDSLGNIYIFDRADCLIKKYDSSSPQRQFIDSWGGCSAESGNFNFFQFEAAVDSNDNIYVADTGHHRIQKFDSSGNYIVEWSITSPIDIVVDSFDNVYVASNMPHYITKYDSSGNQLIQWQKDINNENFQNINGLAIDSSDNIYVADNNGFIEYLKKFNNSGQPISNIYINEYPYGIIIDFLDRIYISSSEDGGSIDRFVFGDFIGYVFDSKIAGENDYVFENPFSVSLGTINHLEMGLMDILLVSDFKESNIKIFSINDETINYMTTLGSYGTSTGQYNMPSKAILKDQYIYVADAFNHRIQRFNVFTEEEISWGSFGDGPGQFGGESLIGGGYILGMTSDSDGNIYVADTFNNRVQKFDADGNYITEWEASYPFGIAIDQDSNIFTSDPFGNNIIQKFDSNGILIKEFGGVGSENGQFNLAAGLFIDFNNYLYVADGNNNRIQKFDTDGNFLDKWGELGGDLAQFNQPIDVAVDNDGNIYVADSGNKRIQVLYISAQRPYDLAVSNSTSNSLSLSWQGNTYNYYIENITNSDASDWIQNNSYTFSNLTCGKNYSFRVKGKTYLGEETDWSDIIEHSIICPVSEPSNDSFYSSELPLPICESVEYNNWEICKDGFKTQFRSIKKTEPANCYLSIEQRQAMERSCSIVDYEEDQKIVEDDKFKNIDQGYLLNIKNITLREKSLVSRVDTQLVNKLKGYILLQAENYGELWYVNPVDNLKYYIGNPLATFNIMRSFGLGVSNKDFDLFKKNGVPDRLLGRIILRVESYGEAYYVNPITREMHYLSRPQEAFEIFKSLSLGISNINIRKIEVGTR